jgi:GrpB-like predicted nucleotidyltransferase (UPF0157 family)
MKILVVDYDPGWREAFERLRSRIWPAVRDIATSIEHVGSTSVPGLAAKPVIDVDIVVPAAADVPRAIERLATLGYVHRGNLGVEGREAFTSPDSSPRHHLYLCRRDSLALANHLAIRDYLRTHPDIAEEYGKLKKQLALQFPDDIDGYIDGKTDLLLRILEGCGFGTAEREAIEPINRRPV